MLLFLKKKSLILARILEPTSQTASIVAAGETNERSDKKRGNLTTGEKNGCRRRRPLHLINLLLRQLNTHKRVSTHFARAMLAPGLCVWVFFYLPMLINI